MISIVEAAFTEVKNTANIIRVMKMECRVFLLVILLFYLFVYAFDMGRKCHFLQIIIGFAKASKELQGAL